MSDSIPGEDAPPALRGTSHSASSAVQAPTGFSQAVNLARVPQGKVQARLRGRKALEWGLGRTGCFSLRPGNSVLCKNTMIVREMLLLLNVGGGAAG